MTNITYDNNHIIIVDYVDISLHICDTCNVYLICTGRVKRNYAWLFEKCRLNTMKVPAYKNICRRIYKIYTMLTYKLFL